MVGMVGGPTFELLWSPEGPDDPEGPEREGGSGGPGTPAAAGWTWRRRPVLVAGAVVGSLVVIAAGVVAGRLLPKDPLPTLTFSDVGPLSRLDPIREQEIPREGTAWRRGDDGRPSGPVTLNLVLHVRRPPASGPDGSRTDLADVRVLGLTGPGVVRSDGTPVGVPVGPASVEVPVRLLVDCEQLPEPLPDDAYRVRFEAGRGSGRRVVVTAAAKAGARWAGDVRAACSTWTAAHGLAVTQLAARVEPAAPQASLTLTLSNTGAHAITVDRGEVWERGVTVSGDLPLRVPPHGSVTAALTVSLHDCNGEQAGPAVPWLVAHADVGTGPGSGSGTKDAGTKDADGWGWLLDRVPGSDVVLAPAARAALATVTGRLCGGLVGAVPESVESRAVRWTPSRRVLSLVLGLDLPAGRVGRVRVLPTDEAGYGPSGLQPRWVAQEVVPDAAGHLRATLTYEVPSDAGCSGTALDLPVVEVDARVREAGVLRTVPFTTRVLVPAGAPARAALCLPDA